MRVSEETDNDDDQRRDHDSVRQHAAAATIAQKVVIVNGTPRCSKCSKRCSTPVTTTSSSSSRASTRTRRSSACSPPGILCVRIDDADGFQVLSMLKLDEETREIPVLTYTTSTTARNRKRNYAEPSEAELFPAAKAAVWMN